MPEVNSIIHQPVRLRVMAALFSLEDDAKVDFTFLRESLGLSDGNLGAHLDKLEAAGYLSVKKAFVKRKPNTSIKLSRKGRRAFEDYVDSMKAIIGASEGKRGQDR